MTDPQTANTIADALARIHDRIDVAAQRAGRPTSDITLVAVSKTFPAQAVRDAIAAGQQDFGENRVEEATEKIREIGRFASRFEMDGKVLVASTVRWHLIGHLQSRKVRDAVGHFDLIHSIDSVKLAAAINQRISNLQSPRGASNLQSSIPTRSGQSLLLECNISGEASKSGFAVAGWERDGAVLDGFMHAVEQIAGLPHVRLRGLMAIAPIVAHPDEARPVFASLRGLRDALRAQFPHIAWDHLSMGMSDDFEAAIAEGATLVRLGRAIFGERVYV